MNPDEIKALRKSRGWTTRQLAEALGVDPKLVQAWESGDQFPTRKAVEKMAKLTDGPPEQSSPWSALRDPTLWTLIRKLAAHPELREKTAKLAADYPDPADRPARG